MKQGTWSVLFGCHSAFHSTLVLISWVKIYRRFPKFWELSCIYLHDIGHWGKDYLNDYELKKHHHELGAKIAGKLFGKKGFDLVTGHIAYDSQQNSALFAPDKYSWLIAPIWWMLSNQIFEPKLIRKGSTRMESVVMFKKAMRENWDKGLPKQGHQIYLEQWNQNK
jgi:hypothetical protein